MLKFSANLTMLFNKDGGLDLEGMRANTRWLLEHTFRAV